MNETTYQQITGGENEHIQMCTLAPDIMFATYVGVEMIGYAYTVAEADAMIHRYRGRRLRAYKYRANQKYATLRHMPIKRCIQCRRRGRFGLDVCNVCIATSNRWRTRIVKTYGKTIPLSTR